MRSDSPARFRDEALAYAFGLGRPRSHERMTGGGSASGSWRIDTDRGIWVVKQTTLGTADRRGRLEDGFAFETALATAGVPLPRPRPLRDGSGGVWVPPDWSGDPVGVTVHEFVDGEPAAYVEPLDVGIPTALALAAALGVAHQIAWRPRIPRTVGRPPGPESWAALRDRATRDHSDAGPVLDALAPMRAFAEPILRAARTPERLAPVHGDANPHNVLRTAAGIRIVDWGDGALMDPQTELAGALLAWGCDENGEPRGDLPARMVRAYRSTGAAFEPVDLTIFRAHLEAMLWWAYSLCELAVGGRPGDPRSPGWALTQVRDTVLAWQPRWRRLDGVLAHVRSA